MLAKPRVRCQTQSVKRAQTIAVTICAIVIAGLVALAIPAFAVLGQTAQWTTELADGVAKSFEPASRSTAPLEEVEESAGVDLTGPEWVHLGNVIVPAGGGIDGCTGEDFAFIERNRLLGKLIDNGPSTYANGTVIYNEGEIAAYVVAEGDSMWSIGERFCIPYVHVYYLNNLHVRGGPHPGQTLYLDPGAIGAVVRAASQNE